ncbi:nucleotidyltransferase domain-containing protein [Saccharopolyspora sp. K220]|uniref:nucleotidyltransferase domain-containing protein n=1 Tax=Saccharopolyspora soli TaxID=2926618 RepID=UPI001F57FD1E|nr:nucleotidyltransferase domain-containing protein [Saccharopolyspora soli]MCI2418884.1 nucleotidyltransferase domain-containing protein [Saccharopolyspora soli]
MGFADRESLAQAVTRALTDAVPGSRVSVIGSLGAGTADEYSDVDLARVVPDGAAPDCADRLVPLLGEVAEVASVRSVPEFQRSSLRRLIFVRLRGVPLFWRLDLQIWAESHAFDTDADVGNPQARGADWSLAESAAMNALGACKAVLRGLPDTADGLLSRGFQRIDEPDPGGGWEHRIAALVAAATRRDAGLGPLGAELSALLSACSKDFPV